MTGSLLDELLEFALAAARQAAQIALRHFQKEPAVDQKPDHSPVRVADGEAEAFIEFANEQQAAVRSHQ